jgi:hypothetical protein
MVMTHHAEFKRLILQIERDLVSQAHLRTLLTHAEQPSPITCRNCEPSRLASSARDMSTG